MTARRLLAASLLSFLTACAGSPARTTPPAPTPAPAAARTPAPAAFDAATLVGMWVARESETPLGPIPFGFDFKLEADGSVHAHTGDDERFVDLRFRRGPDGSWQLDERAALPGVGDQAYTLVPAAPPLPGVHEWRAENKPELLAVRLTPRGGDALTFQVILRGKPHVRFELVRAPGGHASARVAR